MSEKTIRFDTRGLSRRSRAGLAGLATCLTSGAADRPDIRFDIDRNEVVVVTDIAGLTALAEFAVGSIDGGVRANGKAIAHWRGGPLVPAGPAFVDPWRAAWGGVTLKKNSPSITPAVWNGLDENVAVSTTGYQRYLLGRSEKDGYGQTVKAPARDVVLSAFAPVVSPIVQYTPRTTRGDFAKATFYTIVYPSVVDVEAFVAAWRTYLIGDAPYRRYGVFNRESVAVMAAGVLADTGLEAGCDGLDVVVIQRAGRDIHSILTTDAPLLNRRDPVVAALRPRHGSDSSTWALSDAMVAAHRAGRDPLSVVPIADMSPSTAELLTRAIRSDIVCRMNHKDLIIALCETYLRRKFAADGVGGRVPRFEKIRAAAVRRVRNTRDLPTALRETILDPLGGPPACTPSECIDLLDAAAAEPDRYRNYVITVLRTVVGAKRTDKEDA